MLPISKDKHLDQYRKNKELSNSNTFCDEKNFDWKVTILYYSALHLVDSTYADNKFYPSSHESRKKGIKMFLGEDIEDIYLELEELSRKSRYNCQRIKEKHVKKALIALKKLEENLLVSDE